MTEEEKETEKISLLKKIEMPVILGKIDLDKIDNDTRPKLGLSKKQLREIRYLTIKFANQYLFPVTSKESIKKKK